MAAIDTLIQVNVVLAASGVAVPSFGIPLIIGGANAGWSDVVHSYTDPESMLTDGFQTTDQEYKYALKLYSQSRTPSEFFVGHREAAVKQVDTIAVNTVDDTHLYAFTLNGVQISYQASGSNAQQDILAGLLADIATQFPSNAPVTGAVTGTGSGALLTLTSATLGAGVSYSAVDAKLTQVNTVANHGISDDLNAIIAENNSWYGILLADNADYDILQLAGTVESLKKIFLAASNDSDIPTSVSTDLASKLKTLGYNRSGLIYSPGSYNLGIDAAWMGGQLPLTPGSNGWAYVTLAGIAADALSDTARGNIIGDPVAQVAGKNANVYTTVGGINIMQMGQMASGRYIDLQIGLDHLDALIQTNILSMLSLAAQSGSKIPYTDKGSAAFIQQVEAAIAQKVTDGFIDGGSPISVTAPKVATIPAAQRAARLGPPISFSCTAQGAQYSVQINGTVLI